MSCSGVRGIALFVVVVGAASVRAPLSAQVILDTPKSRIEIIGLHRWTLQMIEDSLAAYSPMDSLTGHACAAILRGKLHFADASVNTFIGFPTRDAKQYVAITVVEPQDSMRIHYKPFRYDSLPSRATWAEAFAVLRSQPRVAQQAIQTPAFFADKLAADDSAKFASVEALHDLIARSRTNADFELARHVLETDSAYANRAIAAILLVNFANRDAAWWSLVDALRDPVGIVSSTAAQVLGTMTLRAPRRVDWAPMASRLRYVIDGTNLFAFDPLVQTLTATEIEPALAPALLAGGGDLVRAKLQSSAPNVRDGVVALLARLSGLPVTTDGSAFSEWMNTLR